MRWIQRALIVLAVAAGILGVSNIARGHTEAELDRWLSAWSAEADAGLNSALIADFRDMAERHPCYFRGECPVVETRARESQTATNTTTRVVPRGALSDSQVTQIIGAYFPASEVAKAKRVAWCESRWVPNAQNRRSSAGGLFQFLDKTWASMGGGNKYDPWRNAELAAKLWRQAGWAPWSCGGA